MDLVSRAATTPSKLTPCPTLGLVGADGSPLQIHGSASMMLELNGESVLLDVVVVSLLTLEGIRGLDFLKKQRVSIDLNMEQLFLAMQGCTLLLCKPEQSVSNSRMNVCKIETPAYSELEVYDLFRKAD